MAETECPLCGSQRFYIKDAEDQFEMYEFDLKEGEIAFDPEVSGSELPDVTDETETYCDKCAWHGKLETLKRKE
jgi:hypothetical protein